MNRAAPRPYADLVKARDLAVVAETRAALASGRARALREAAGIAQAEFAATLGVARSAVSQWEAGKRTPGAEHALAYGRLLEKLTRSTT